MGGYDPSLSETIYAFKQILADELTRKELHVTQYAALLNESSERIYKYLNLGIPHRFPADLIPMHTSLVGPELIRTMLAPVHYAVVELPRVLPDWKDAMSLAARLTQECADVLIRLTKCIEDESMSIRENRELARAVQQAVGALLSVQVVANLMTKVVPRMENAL